MIPHTPGALLHAVYSATHRREPRMVGTAHPPYSGQGIRMQTSRLRLMSQIGSLLLVLMGGEVAAQSLAQLQFDIVGIKLAVDPPALTVPKDLSTFVNAQLVLPTG